MSTDQLTNLIDRYKSGDTSAFNAIYAATHVDLYRYARRLTSNEALIDDAIQDTYIKIADNIPALRDPAGFAAWGRTILRNNINDAFRKDRHSVLMSADISGDVDGSSSDFFDSFENEDADYIPGESLDRREVERIIRNAMEELSDVQKQTLTYFYYDEMSIADIALLMECSRGTVKSRLRSGRERLRLAIAAYEKQNGIRIHAALPFALISSALKAADKTLPASVSPTGAVHSSRTAVCKTLKMLKAFTAPTIIAVCTVCIVITIAAYTLTGSTETKAEPQPGPGTSDTGILSRADGSRDNGSTAKSSAGESASIAAHSAHGGKSPLYSFSYDRPAVPKYGADGLSGYNSDGLSLSARNADVSADGGHTDAPRPPAEEQAVPEVPPDTHDIPAHYPISYEAANNNACFIGDGTHASLVIAFSDTTLIGGYTHRCDVGRITDGRAELCLHMAYGDVKCMNISADAVYCVVGSSVYAFDPAHGNATCLFTAVGPVNDLTVVDRTFYYSVGGSIYKYDISSGVNALFANGMSGFYCCDNSFLYGISGGRILRLSLYDATVETVADAKGADTLMLDTGTLYYGLLESTSAQILYSIKTNGTGTGEAAVLPALTRDIYVKHGDVYIMADHLIYKNGSMFTDVFYGRHASMIGADSLNLYVRSGNELWQVPLSGDMPTQIGKYE